MWGRWISRPAHTRSYTRATLWRPTFHPKTFKRRNAAFASFGASLFTALTATPWCVWASQTSRPISSAATAARKAISLTGLSIKLVLLLEESDEESLAAIFARVDRPRICRQDSLDLVHHRSLPEIDVWGSLRPYW